MKHDPIALERQYLEYAVRLPSFVRESADFKTEVDFYTGALVMKLWAYVMSEAVEDDTYTLTFRVPRDWWQMWKRDHAPAWFINRWPIQMELIEESVKAEKMVGYPELPLAMPDCGHQLKFIKWEPMGLLHEEAGEA